MTAFEGLTQENFQAYTEDKWSSMVHNLTRMKAKDTLSKLVKALVDGHQLKFNAMVAGSSDEIPNITNGKQVDAQWFYWYRDKSQRDSLNKILDRLELSSDTVFQTSPQDKHIVIGLKLSETALEVGLFIAPTASVDRRNLRARLEQSWGKEKAAESCKSHGDGLKLFFHDLEVELSQISDANLDAITEHLANDSKETLFIGRRFLADEATESGTQIVETIAALITPLEALYKFFAWSRDNDSIDVAKEIEVQKKVQREKASQHKVGDKVRITTGLLAGKRGIIESLDGKGKAKVSVGLMSMQVATTDLVTD